MYEIIKIVFGICLFRKGPQDLPYSIALQALLTVLYGCIRFLMLSLHSTWIIALLQIIVELLLIFGFSWVMLYLNRKPQRFNQVANALIGTDTLINFLALPGVLSLEIGRGGSLVFFLLIGFIGWQCAVIAHIIHHASDQKLAFSFGLALLYILTTYQVIALLFPKIAEGG